MEQSRIRTIVNCMADGVLVTNRDLEVVLYNPALMRLLERSTPANQPAPLSAFLTDEQLMDGLRSMLNQEGGGERLPLPGTAPWAAASAGLVGSHPGAGAAGRWGR